MYRQTSEEIMKSTIIITVLVIVFCRGNGETIGNLSSHIGHHDANGRASGGREAKAHSVPYMVYLKANLKPSGTRICAGTLISANYVLTAKRCLYETSSVDIYLGVHDITNTKDRCREQQSARNSRSEGHRQFYKHPSADLALIKLESSVDKKSGCIDYVKLPTWQDTRDINRYKYEHGDIYGWGALWGSDGDKTSKVLYRLQSVRISNARDDYLLTQGWGSMTNKKPCIGDGGAPLIQDGVQVGIAYQDYKQLKRCEEGEVENYFAAVAQNLKWIERHSDVKIKDYPDLL